MRIERSINTVSWIPSDLLEGMGKMADTHEARAP